MSKPEHADMIATRFQDVVTTTVKPTLDMPARPIYHHSAIQALRSVEIDNTRLSFMLFHLNQVSSSGGLQGLGFIPSHGVEVTRHREFFGGTKDQAMIGLNQQNRLVRAYHVGGQVGMLTLRRELGAAEEEVFVEYLEAPHVRSEYVSAALELNAEEQDKLAAFQVKDGVDGQKLRDDLQAMDATRRRAWQNARNHIIG